MIYMGRKLVNNLQHIIGKRTLVYFMMRWKRFYIYSSNFLKILLVRKDYKKYMKNDNNPILAHNIVTYPGNATNDY